MDVPARERAGEGQDPFLFMFYLGCPQEVWSRLQVDGFFHLKRSGIKVGLPAQNGLTRQTLHMCAPFCLECGWFQMQSGWLPSPHDVGHVF